MMKFPLYTLGDKIKTGICDDLRIDFKDLDL